LFRHQRDWAVEKPLAPLLKIAKQMEFTARIFNACPANQDLIDGIGGRENARRKSLVSILLRHSSFAAKFTAVT